MNMRSASLRAVDKAVRRSAGAFVSPVWLMNTSFAQMTGATPGPSGHGSMARGGDARRVRSLIAHSRGSAASKAYPLRIIMNVT